MKHHALAVSTTSGFGHINPMLELSVRLGPFGFQVSFLVSEDNHGKVQSKLSTMGSMAEHIRLVVSSQEHNLLTPVQSSTQDMVAIANRLTPRVTCIISDVFVIGAQDAADKLGIPRIAFWTGSVMVDVIFNNIPKLQSSGHVPLEGSGHDDELITFLPGIPQLHTKYLPFCLMPDAPVINSFRDAHQQSTKALCVLVNSIHEIEREIVDAQRSMFKNYFPVGPLVPSISDENFKESKWLDDQRPSSVLYIAFGSQTLLPLEQVEKLAEGLKASQQPFIWAFRKDSVVGAPQEYSESMGMKFGGQGLVVDWVPQMALLKHPSIGGFLTHCGWNSTLETICCGVPTLCWPCGAEQNLNAYLLVETWKVGLLLCSKFDGYVTVEKIRNSIQELLTGDVRFQMKERMADMKRSINGALESDGSSCRNIRDFVNILEAYESSK